MIRAIKWSLKVFQVSPMSAVSAAATTGQAEDEDKDNEVGANDKMDGQNKKDGTEEKESTINSCATRSSYRNQREILSELALQEFFTTIL